MKTLFYFVFIVFLSFVGYYIQNIFITTDIVFEEYGQQMAYERIVEILDSRKKHEWIFYSFTAIIRIIKILIVSLIIYTILLAFYSKVAFKKILETVILAELIPLIAIFIKFIWFSFIQTDYSLKELELFYPLSAITLFDYNNLEIYYIQGLQLINIFELFYWFVLAYGISRLVNTTLKDGMKVVLSSYVPALFLWVVFVTFLTINMT